MSGSSRPASAQSRKAWQNNGDMGLVPTSNDSNGQSYGMESSMYGNKFNEQKEPKPPVGICGKIMKGIRSLWATRDTEETKGDRELHVKTTLRELIIYIIFLAVLCVITFGMTSTSMYYYTKAMTDLFIDSTYSGGGSFRTITTVGDVWKFTKGPLMDSLYWEKWYNEEPIVGERFIYYENKLLGLPRLRQLRVRNDSCVVHSDFKNTIKTCYDSYSENNEDHEQFGKAIPPEILDAYKYRSKDELKGTAHWGQLETYGIGGFIQDLTKNKTGSLKIVNALFDNLWIDRGTRVLFIDFTVYNANINLFCVMRLVVEFPATGGALSSWKLASVKLIRYVNSLDYFVMACEAIFVLFILYYIIEETIEIKKHKLSYFKCFWNILDMLVIFISVLCIAFNVYRTIAVGDKLNQLLSSSEKYSDFQFLAFCQTHFNNAIAVTVFMAWIKIFKYISFNKTMTQLSSTLGKCAKDLAGFAVMFFIIFLAFTQLGYLIFGTQVKEFSSFEDAFFTLFRIILGDFDFHQLESANRILGPIFFILYVFFVFFILLNMFLAIINDTYSEVKGDIANQKSEFEVTDYFKRGYQRMVDKLNFKRDKIIDIQKALQSADVNNDKQLDFEEWRQDMKSRGFADEEIELMFAKYDINGDRILDENEQKKMQADLCQQKAALNKEYDELEEKANNRCSSRMSYQEDSGEDSDDEDNGSKVSRSGRITNGVSYEEFTVLSRRVDRMEHSIGSIVSKIDAVLVKLEAMEKAKIKRRETMAKMLDSITESTSNSDEMKRDQMEKLVREELERWDSEASIGQTNGRGDSPGSSSGAGTCGLRPRSSSRPGSGQNLGGSHL
ncbi:polycystin-2-like isoform X1 [Argonauta hians]